PGVPRNPAAVPGATGDHPVSAAGSGHARAPRHDYAVRATGLSEFLRLRFARPAPGLRRGLCRLRGSLRALRRASCTLWVWLFGRESLWAGIWRPRLSAGVSALPLGGL